MRVAAALAMLAAIVLAQAAAAQPFDPCRLAMSNLRATVHVDGKSFRLGIDKKLDGIVILPTFKVLGGAMAGGVDPVHWPSEYWRQAAEALVTPVGCGIPDVGVYGKNGFNPGIWWATYKCPPGVDLRKLMADQHDALMRGEPLHP